MDLAVKGLILIDSPSPIDHEHLPTQSLRTSSGRNSSAQLSNNNAALVKEFQFNTSLLESYKAAALTQSNILGLKNGHAEKPGHLRYREHLWCPLRLAQQAGCSLCSYHSLGKFGWRPYQGSAHPREPFRSPSRRRTQVHHVYIASYHCNLALTISRSGRLARSFGKHVSMLRSGRTISFDLGDGSCSFFKRVSTQSKTACWIQRDSQGEQDTDGERRRETLLLKHITTNCAC